MARKTEHVVKRQAFFKALKGDFSQDLVSFASQRIPSAFIKNLHRRSLHMCRLKGPGGQCWTVRLEKSGARLFFRKGWEKFVQHHPLEVGDFLIFSYDGESMFDVTIYGKTLCDKNIKASKRLSDIDATAAAKRRVDHVEEHVPSVPFKSNNAFIFRTLKSALLYEVYVPTEISKVGFEAGKFITIRDTFGMLWHIRVRGSSDRVLMRSGLAKICKANKTAPGDTLIFEFVEPGLVQLHIIKAGTY